MRSGSEPPREAASVITTRSNPRCRSWHLHVCVLQHDGIRVGLLPYMLLCLDERGKITDDHQNTLWSSREANQGQWCASTRRPRYISNRMTGLLQAGRSHRCRAPAPGLASQGLALGAQPLLEKTPVSVSEDTLTRQGRPPPPIAQVHHRTGGWLPLFNACSTVNLSTGITPTSGC